MQEMIDVLIIYLFTPGRTAIMIAGFIPALFGLFLMLTARNNPQKFNMGHGFLLLGTTFASIVIICVFYHAVFY